MTTKPLVRLVDDDDALSKRTTLYTGMGYVQREVEFTETDSTSTKYEGKAYDFVAGLVHRF